MEDKHQHHHNLTRIGVTGVEIKLSKANAELQQQHATPAALWATFL